MDNPSRWQQECPSNNFSYFRNYPPADTSWVKKCKIHGKTTTREQIEELGGCFFISLEILSKKSEVPFGNNIKTYRAAPSRPAHDSKREDIKQITKGKYKGLVSRGQTAITINGEIGNFFRNGRGYDKGTPSLSSCLITWWSPSPQSWRTYALEAIIICYYLTPVHYYGLCFHVITDVILE